MSEAPRPGDDRLAGPDPRESARSSSAEHPGSLTARIRAVQREERRRRMLRTAAICAAVVAVIGLAVVVSLMAFGSSPDDTGATGASQRSDRSSTTVSQPTVTTGTSAPTSTTSDLETSTTGGTTAAPRVECDTAAITAALLEAPEPYEIDGTPNCSESFWAVPALVPSDNEELTVVFKVGPGGPEPISVEQRSQCPSVVSDEPTFDTGLCPS